MTTKAKLFTTTVGGKDLELSIHCKFLSYNCGTRMFGRVFAQAKCDGKEVPMTEDIRKLFDANKAEIINAWGEELNTNAAYPPLDHGGQNPLWPADGGHYIPTILLYADGLRSSSGEQWFTDGRELIRAIQGLGKKTKFVVLESVNFSTRIYGYNHWSRLWTVIPPHSVPYVVLPQNKDTQIGTALKKHVGFEGLPQQDKDGLLAAL